RPPRRPPSNRWRRWCKRARRGRRHRPPRNPGRRTSSSTSPSGPSARPRSRPWPRPGRPTRTCPSHSSLFDRRLNRVPPAVQIPSPRPSPTRGNPGAPKDPDWMPLWRPLARRYYNPNLVLVNLHSSGKVRDAMPPTGHHHNRFCPLTMALDVLGDPWSLLVVRALMLGPRPRGSLCQFLTGLDGSALNDTLGALVT